MAHLPIENYNGRQAIIGSKPANGSGQSVIYIMSREQRVCDNHALLAAQAYAVQCKLPLAVIFVCNTTRAHRAVEQYDFMLQGLLQVEADLNAYNIPLIGLVGPHESCLKAAFHHLAPAAIFADFNPLKGPQSIVQKLAKEHHIIVVDSHNIVPVWVASDKQEYSARTIRPKIHHSLADYFVEPQTLIQHPYKWPNNTVVPFAEVIDIFQDRLDKVSKNHSNLAFAPGENVAHKQLAQFLRERFSGYAVNRNNPTHDGLSQMSPYLHFGQISSLRILLEAKKYVQQNNLLQTDYDTLLEELVIRKELSDNFCLYNTEYGSLKGAPEWALQTLTKHSVDIREYTYTQQQFEYAQTHDAAWNAAQNQLRNTGKMHGYMRMYWAKKVLEWSPSPEEAHKTLVYLNDFYSIDGGDPNGYVGILWSIAGLHDRPWGERAVYGTVRSMVYSGLKRKFNVDEYISQNVNNTQKYS